MKDDLIALIEESIRLEWLVSELYTLFHKDFPQDAEFWWTLAVEEKNHAALIQSGKQYFQPVDRFPQELLSPGIQAVRKANIELKSLISLYMDKPPSRGEAFHAALELERSAGELHFQQFMSKASHSKLDEIFKELNRGDKDHSERIRLYMERQGFNRQACES